MPRRQKYPEELYQRGVRLVLESGRPISHIARDIGLPAERISGGHTSVGAMPASYQLTPVILGGGGRHGKSQSDPELVDRRN
jgi:hypothetical protein